MSVLPILAPKDLEMVNSLSGILATPAKFAPFDDTPSFAVKVPGMAREVTVKMASTRSEWEGALQLVTENYRQRGYESPKTHQLRFTAYHALPDSVVFVAKHREEIVMTTTLISDNTLLGLPMEELYGSEINKLRADGRNLVEVTSLADRDLNLREFTPVFTTIMRMLAQYGIYSGCDTFAVAINPRHRRFYANVMGFIPFGPLRNYPCVQNHPAEAYMGSIYLLKANAPKMYDQLFGQWLDPDDLVPYRMPPELVREFSARSSQATIAEIEEIIEWTKMFGSSRRW